MYSRNTSVRTEVTPQSGYTRYRYAMPPQYGGSRFRRQSGNVIALPDSAFSAPGAEESAVGAREASSPAASPEETLASSDAVASEDAPASASKVPETVETAGLAERLGGLFGEIGKDDLLLAAVIVLLYAEKRGSGTIDNELVLILAILLGTR